MDSKPDKGFNLMEYGRAVGEFLLEPVTFTRLLHERLERFSAEQLIPVGLPVAVAVMAGVNYGPVVGTGAGIAFWLLFAKIGRSIRTMERP